MIPSRDFHFRKKKVPEPNRYSSHTNPSRTENLAIRTRAELRLLQNITDPEKGGNAVRIA